ncbi:MAG: [Fe-Fe] hydrogenase large subunit C-terminal domain-containing protein [Oscillospiraceae bacterium]|nr:[Fe-Fe] hydrogenase large subunit C-terminal domain-containing protein [Oscillospiraceae bacterium]
MSSEFYHSVHLDVDLCMGCINCIKRCPTQAIRVQNSKARIIKEFCIDCGECIRICPHHAKTATYDSLDVLKDFEYTVALPAPSLYAQFNHLDDVNIVLSALRLLGFDDVYEVSAAAEMISEMSRNHIKENPDSKPFISTACPSVVRLIRVRFPNLIDHLLPFVAPIDLAALMARKKAVQLTGLNPDQIGIIFISPCPAKVTACKEPLGSETSNIDAVVAIKEVYPRLLPLMKTVCENPDTNAISGRIGVGWGGSGGEAAGLLTDSYLAADGIENVIRVLEDLEDQKFTDLDFIELNACNGGCVGGVLCVENPYVAQAKLKKLCRYLPISRNHIGKEILSGALLDKKIEYEPVYRLGSNLSESIAMMAKIDELCKKFPGLDCGFCGAPTCRALAEDIARGAAVESDCVPLFRKSMKNLSEIISLSNRKEE